MNVGMSGYICLFEAGIQEFHAPSSKRIAVATF